MRSGWRRWGWWGRGGRRGGRRRSAARYLRGRQFDAGLQGAARRDRIAASGYEEAIAMDVKEAVVTAKSHAAAVRVLRPSGFFIEAAKIVLAISVPIVVVVDAWLLNWYVVTLSFSILGWVLSAVGWALFAIWYGIQILIVVAIWAPILVGEYPYYGEIPVFVVQWIALLVIIVVTLPIGDFRLGDFFKDNRRHSLLVVFPLGLFTWIMLYILGTSLISSSSIPMVLLEAALAFAAFYSLHIVIFRRTTQDDIPKDPYSLNKRKRSLSRYIFRVSMLSATIWAILGIGIDESAGLGLQLIIMTITAGVSLVIRIFSSGDFSENNKLFFVAAVLPIPIIVLWVLLAGAAFTATFSNWAP